MMAKASRGFQVFVKPVGPVCNLDCRYCYYLKKEHLYPEGGSCHMSDDVLEQYIVQHIEASPDPVIRFSWHGGEPTLFGLEGFRKIVRLQRKVRPPGRRIANGMQTNGTLLDDAWCRFLAEEGFTVGLSLDGPAAMHNKYRRKKNGEGTFEHAMRGYELLRKHGVACEMLCVVNAFNVQHPGEIYRFFRRIKTPYITFIPLVEPQPDEEAGASPLTVPADDWGQFLCTIFDEWSSCDIGQIKVQIFEEAARTAFGQEHSLCIFRPVCGDIPVVEHDGDFFCCDHFVDADHHLGNIRSTPLVELLESSAQKAFGQAKLDALPRYCMECEVRDMCNGGCPKNRIIKTPDGEHGLNHLCAGYRRFFNHCRPFVEEVSAVWRGRQAAAHHEPAAASKMHKAGRNDPCPCGSGRKYKRCCLEDR